jgi:hypothetical protein
MHANECLEMLDHEFSATGGLLSLLPTNAKYDSEDLAAARNSLLGQWLLFNQHLVARMHELEIGYGNSLDVLAGEAAVPMQMHGRIGAIGQQGSGREIAYPQDRWILANAGDDVLDILHRMFDRQEAQIEEKERIWAKSGVSGERVWREDRGGDWYARGLVPLDIMTRYYRLKGLGRSTIFVLPAWEFHPKCAGTQKIEQRPTVVSVATPIWPVRISDWEIKYRKKLDEATVTSTINKKLSSDLLEKDQQIHDLAEELMKLTFAVQRYESGYPKEAKDELRELRENITQYRAKLQDLEVTLPEEYHELLSMDSLP